MERGVIIVAGGAGLRMRSEKPKQFLELEGKPVVVHTIERFIRFDGEISIVLVIAAEHRFYWEEIAEPSGLGSRVRLAEGGATRYDSVKNGLELIGEETLVGIHDAVRPLVSNDTLTRCYDAARLHGSGIPVLPVEETMRMISAGGGSKHLDRSMLRRVQTPQVFQSDRIRQAYSRPHRPAFTDDASVYESCFDRVVLVEGNRENIKITGPADLQLAALLLRSQ